MSSIIKKYSMENKIKNQQKRIWLYVIDDRSYTEYEEYVKKSDEVYLGSYYKYKIKKEDIIIFYKRNKNKNKETGFIGIGICNRKAKSFQERPITIFKDNNNNRYNILLESIILMGNNIEFNIFQETIQKKYYKSIASFKRLYFNKNMILQEIPYDIGEIIYNNIYSKYYDLCKLQNNREENGMIEEKVENGMIEEKVEKVERVEMILIEEDTYYEDKDEQIREKEREYYDDKEKNAIGNVPILIEPCKKLIKKIKINSENTKTIKNIFINHYKQCKKCDVTNNGSRELSSIFNTMELEYKEDTEENLSKYMEYYHRSEVYKIDDNRVVINNIIDKYSIYDGCLLIIWGENVNITNLNIDSINNEYHSDGDTTII
jgi:hypothetical protein